MRLVFDVASGIVGLSVSWIFAFSQNSFVASEVDFERRYVVQAIEITRVCDGYS